MTERPKIKLSRLREISWALWDPIGLRPVLEDGNDSVADEYDGYLLEVAGRLSNGASPEETAEYLVEIESEHMGLGLSPGASTRAAETAAAIARYLESLRTAHG